MLMLQQKQRGFTIVELLIVVVVIAILAAISIVAYTGISNRANDSAVQNDLRNFANKIMEYHTLNGQYPTGHVNLGGGSGHGAVQGLESFPFAQSSYSTDTHNIYYCARGDTFAVAGSSKSGTRYFYRNGAGLTAYTGGWTNADNICPGILGAGAGINYSFAFHTSNGWSAMAK